MMAPMRSMFILFIGLMLVFPANGQRSQKPCSKCYVVMNNGDTIKCSVENQEDYTHMKKVQIQVNNSEEVRNVKVKNIQALCIPGKFYEKIELEIGYHLLERVANGYVRMYKDYSFEWKGRNGTDPDVMVDIEAENPDPEKTPVYYVLIREKIYRLDKNKFRTQLERHINDYQDISDKLKNEDLRYADLVKVVKDYNHWKAKQIKEPKKDK